MTCWEVKDYLNELTDISAYEEEEILSLCRTCLKEIDSKLKSSADKSDFRIAAAAAGLAYYKMTLKQYSVEDAENVTSFKAGDVSIEQETRDREKLLSQAESFYEKKMLDILSLCRDDSFAFNQIKVM